MPTQAHPSADRLTAFGLGRLAGDDAAAVEEHLLECDTCVRLLEWQPEDLLLRLARLGEGDVVLGVAQVTPPPADLATPPSALAPAAGPLEGVALPGYEILGELGRGGMGVVYKARQRALNRIVALKMILSGAYASPHDLARFLVEAEAVAQLQHPGIVQIFEAGQHQGLPYFTLEFCPGGSLAECLRDAALPPRQAARLVEQLAQAIAYAHGKGIVHRDLKPENVLLASGGCEPPESAALSGGSHPPLAHAHPPLAQCTLKITDFGLAKRTHGDGGLTISGAVLGTPSYMAPEQAGGKSRDIGSAADVYALGALLYRLLTGRPPFQALTPLETLTQVVSAEPVPPTRLQPGVPRDLETVCLRCLEKQPRQRYASAAALAEDLGRFLADRPVRARRASLLERIGRWCRRKPVVALLSLAVALLLLVVAVGAAAAIVRLEAAHRATRAQLRLTENAERDKTDKLWQSYLDRARAGRFSQRPGQRFDSLQALAEAARIRFDPRLRDEAIACLALPDVHQTGAWDLFPDGSVGLDFDDALRHVARTDAAGNVTVIRLNDGREVARLAGTGGPVAPLFSPDGRFLILHRAAPTQEVRLWRPGAARPFAVLREDPNVTEIQVRPDGRQLAVVHKGGGINLYELPAGRRSTQLQAGQARQLAYDPTSKRLAAFGGPYPGKERRDVTIFDTRSGKQEKVLHLSREAAGVTWHPDGRTLFTGSVMGQVIEVWDVDGPPQPINFAAQQGGSLYFGINRSGDVLASTSTWAGGLRLWHPRTGQQFLAMPGNHLTFRRSTPDGRLFAWATEGKRVRLWEVDPGREYCTLVRHSPGARANYLTPALSPDGRLLAVGLGDGVGLWDLPSGDEIGLLPLGETPAVTFDSSGALWTCSLKVGLMRWPVVAEAGRPESLRIGPPQRLLVGQTSFGMSLSADAQVVAVAQGKQATVIHRDRPGPPIKLSPLRDARGVAVSPDGRWVVTGSHWFAEVKVWDARSGALVKEIPVGTVGNAAMQFSPDGKWLAFRDELWEAGSWQRGSRLSGVIGSWSSRSFSADGRLLALAKQSGDLLLYDLTARQVLARLENPTQARAGCNAFSPDGTRLVFTSIDSQAIHVWNLRRLRAHLARLGLDWEAPAYPPATGARPRKPLTVRVEGKAFVRPAP